jgi:DNA-binding response OmpR family regulator
VRKRILVVDDDTDVAEPLGILLSRSYDVDFAVNGADAVSRVRGTQYDAVVLDLMMPVMDGPAFKSWLDEQHIEIPVLLVSGSTDLAVRAETMRVADHLAKPLDPAVLHARLAAILERRSASDGTGGSGSDPLPSRPLAAQGRPVR